MIGLSGLITPSLDEMVTVAEEMQRAELTMPLLIGGATTSKVHTALRIDPAYDGPVIHVLDASRAVGVASKLLSDTQWDELRRHGRAGLREGARTRAGKDRPSVLLTLERRAPIIYDARLLATNPPPPVQPDVHVFDDWDLADLRDYIDWTPFFRAWELAGNYPAILKTKWWAKARRSCSPTRRRCSTRLSKKNG